MHEYLPPKNTQEAAASIGILFFEMLQRNTGHSWEKKIHTDTPFPEETFILLQSHLSRFWLKIGTISPDDFNLWNELYIIFESIYTPGNAKHLLALCKKISSAQQEPVITQYGALPRKTTELLLPCIKNTTIETAK
jgi:hypothetical protein